MRTIFFIPSLRKMSGGLAAIFELADILRRQGRSVALSGPAAAPGTNGAAAAESPFPDLEWLPWDELSQGRGLVRGDLLCVPESWPNAMAPGLKAGLRILVYAQNWIFFLNNLPAGVAWRQLPLEYLAVSRPVAWFMRETLGLSVRGILPAAVPPVFFELDRSQPPAGKIRVAWMPRKNRALGRQILQIAASRLELETGAPALEIVEIDKLSREEVAARLAGVQIFLSTGFPEGFALPPLEAMAAGCVPVGFAGLGGFEYMRNPEASDLPGLPVLYRPPFELPALPWKANGLFVADGDVLGAGLALARAACLAAAPAENPLWNELLEGARLSAAAYGLAERERQAALIWDELEG